MKRQITIFLLVCLIALVIAIPASAQTGTYTLHVSFGSDVNSGQYLHTDYTLVEGVIGSPYGNPVPGVKGLFDRVVAGFDINNAQVNVTLPVGCTLTSVEYEIHFEDVQSNGSTNIVQLLDETETVIHTFVNAQQFGTENSWTTKTYTGSWTGGVTLLVYIEGRVGASGSEAGHMAFDNIVFTCEDIDEPEGDPGPPPFYQPIKEAEQVDVFTPTDPDTEEILAASRISATAVFDTEDLKNNSSAIVNVYSPFPGTVTSVVQTQDGLFAVRIDGTGDADGYTATYSNLSNVYILSGDTVEGGCVIGVAGPQFAAVDGELDSDIQQIIFSVTEVDPEDPEIGILQDWTVYFDPESSEICGGLLRYEDCINNNPQFNEGGAAWRYGNDAGFSHTPEHGNGYTRLSGKDYIAQDLWLPVMETYYVTIAATPQGPFATLSVTIGDQTIQQVFKAEAQGGTSSVAEVGPFTDMEPSAGENIYTLKIRNEDSANAPYGVYINFVCVHIDGADARTPPAACYFPNPQFETDESWVLDGGATIESAIILGGYLSLPLDATAQQGVYLYPNADSAAEYRVRITARHTPGTLDVDDATLEASLDTLEVDDAVTFTVNNAIFLKEYIHEFEVPMGDVADGDYIVEATALDLTLDAIEIGEICLEPIGGIWPGYENASSTAPTCRTCSFPGFTLDVVVWLQWIGCLLSYFLGCTIPNTITSLIAFITPITQTLTLFGNWLWENFRRGAAFIYSIIAWVAGKLLSAGIAVAGAIWEWLIAQPWFAALYDIISAALLLPGRLWDLIVLIASLPGYAIGGIVQLLKVIPEVWAAIVAGYNSASPPDIGMIDCDTFTGTETLASVCWGLTRAENAVSTSPFLSGVIFGIQALLIAMWALWAKGTIESEFKPREGSA